MIGKVTFKKTGKTIRFINNRMPDDQRYIVDEINCILTKGDLGNELAGFAFVVWTKEGSSISSCRVQDCCKIPRALVPDYVRNLLLSDVIQHWVREEQQQGENK